MWASVLSINFPLLFCFKKFEYEFAGANHSTCIYLRLFHNIASPLEVWTFYLGFVIWAYIIPLSIITVLYVLMIRKLWANSFRGQGMTTRKVKLLENRINQGNFPI